MTYQLKAIGKVKNDENGTFIQLEPEYIPGLQALEGFSHINAFWWFSDCDNDADRNELQLSLIHIYIGGAAMHAYEVIEQSLIFIEEHLTKDISTEELANTVGLSPFYFQRLFKRLVNKPVQEYVKPVSYTHLDVYKRQS